MYATLLLDMERRHLWMLRLEGARDAPRRVGARVVGDHDAERERELLAQVREQLLDARAEHVLLVVDRDHELDRLQVRVHETSLGRAAKPQPRTAQVTANRKDLLRDVGDDEKR
jgi:hypothetical protein